MAAVAVAMTGGDTGAGAGEAAGIGQIAEEGSIPRLWKQAAVSGLRTRARTLAVRVLRFLMAALPRALKDGSGFVASSLQGRLSLFQSETLKALQGDLDVSQIQASAAVVFDDEPFYGTLRTG
jgi:hypothetical protein